MDVAIRENRYIFRKMMVVPTVAKINKDFLIRWKSSDELAGHSNLISAGKYEEKFGRAYMEKHFMKAVASSKDRITFKIRGLYEITFISR